MSTTMRAVRGNPVAEDAAGVATGAAMGAATAEGATTAATDGTTGRWRWVALASGTAGVIHLAVTPEHLEEWWVYGTFFIVVGCFQVVLAAVALRRPHRNVALAGLLANLAVVLVYVASRTTGLPIEPPEDITSHAWSHVAEGAGPADLTATAAELAVVCLLATLLSPRLRRTTVNLLLLIGVGLWVLRLSGALD